MSTEAIKTNLPLENADFAKVPTFLEVCWAEFKKDKLALVSLVIFVIVNLFVFIYVPIFTNDADVRRTNIRIRQAAPGEIEGHWLGTDPAGRDMWLQLVVGARNSLMIAYAVSTATAIIGLGIGLISGVYGGNVDNVIMRISDTWAMLPAMMMIITINVIFGINSIWPLIGVFIIFGWPGRARFIRNLALQQGRMEYVAASKTLGTRNLTIVFREVLPNLTSMILVNIVLNLAGSIGMETGLTVLGFGVRADTPSLGTLVSYALDAGHLILRPHLWAPAIGLLIVITTTITFASQAVSRAGNARLRRS
jgi:peptide/nickel transport system permease protein